MRGPVGPLSRDVGERRRVDVAPERLERWLRSWEERHRGRSALVTPDVVTFQGADGATARCRVPFPPLAEHAGDIVDALVGHALRERTVAVLLCRRGGHAVGVFLGPRLLASKVGSRLVHGRSAAGGWSQHRFARRRANQAHHASEAAAVDLARVLEPCRARLDAVVVGGDRAALTVLARDARLAPFFARAEARRLDALPTPRLRVLLQAPRHFRAVTIEVHDAGP